MHFFRLTNRVPLWVLFFLLACTKAFPNLVLTELLSDPVGGESQCPGGACLEFVEFTNLGCSPISLDRLLLTDGRVTDSLIVFSEPIPPHADAVYTLDSLHSGQSLLILDPDYPSAPLSDKFAIKGMPVICTVNHRAILGGLTDRRALFLYRGTKSHVEDSLYALINDDQQISLHQQFSFTGTIDIPEGASRVPGMLPFASPDWKSSHTLTPGYLPDENNRWIVNYRLFNHTPGVVRCSVAIFDRQPAGKNTAFWSVTDHGGHPLVDDQPIDECLIHGRVDLPLDTISYQIMVGNQTRHVVQMIDLSGYILPTHSLCFSEISPRKKSFTEWIELTNASSIPINLADFCIHTAQDSFPVSIQSTLLQPAAFVVLARDARIFTERYPLIKNVLQPPDWETLDDYRDTLYITHTTGRISDSAIYDSQWFGQWDEGSLQRMDVTESGTDEKSWTLSESVSPGLPNQNRRWRRAHAPSLEIGPSPFTPNGDGKDDKLLISLSLPIGYTADLEIYSFDGVLRMEQRGYSQEKYLWDGKDRFGKSAPVGPIFVVLTATKESGSEKIIRKGILWR